MFQGHGAIFPIAITITRLIQQVYVAAEDFVSEQALWIRGWKHQGRLEATVESRAILLGKVEMRIVLQDLCTLFCECHERDCRSEHLRHALGSVIAPLGSSEPSPQRGQARAESCDVISKP